MPNRLASETSPYLLQHANNPVDWYPWGSEAFERAASENKPIFLSVGYSSCHWCHVMEHESFEDEGIAALLNESFVCVKVDREERPDVDEVYMTAVQLGSGRGGWPMSVFLAPDKSPFFAGTYFPKEDRDKYPGFGTILKSIAIQWKSSRAQLLDVAKQFEAALRETRSKPAPQTFAKLDSDLLDNAIRGICSDFDPQNGGFGAAPKFPPHSAIELLMDYALRPQAPADLREAALGVSLYTLHKIALGGIHDHVGGGFHRYSTDEKWLLPHFEKMLYDNALLLGNFVRASDIAQEIQPDWAQLFLRAAHGIVAWTEREMVTPEGLFASALDADSEGEEGKYYVWPMGDVSPGFAKTYGFTQEGNFKDEATGEAPGTNIPHLVEIPVDFHDAELQSLAQKRTSRVRPGLDDKAIVGWNGLMIGALSEAGIIGLAERAAAAILGYANKAGQLPHQIAKGKSTGPAMLEDYAALISGLLKLAEARAFFAENRDALKQAGMPYELPEQTRDWIAEAHKLHVEMVANYYDEEAGGFFSTKRDAEDLFGRVKPVFDQPILSSNALGLRSLIAFGDERRAFQTAEALKGWVERAPGACEALIHSMIPLLADAVAAPVAPTPVSAEVKVTMTGRELTAGSDGWASTSVVIEIPEGFHVNSSQPPARWLEPTVVEVRPVASKVDWPVATNDQYSGTITIPLQVQLPAGAEAEEFEVVVKWQACTEQECLLPQERSFGAVILKGR